MRHPLTIVAAILLFTASHLVMSASWSGTDAKASPSATEPSVYIVELEDDPVATYRGGISGLAATHPGTIGQRRLDTNSNASRAYARHLAAQQGRIGEAMRRSLARDPDILFSYHHAFNGFAVSLTAAEAAQVASLSGVRRVERERVEHLHTDAGPGFIGAGTLWGGQLQALGYSATLNGGSVVPAVSTGAAASGTFTIDFATSTLDYSIAHNGLTGITSASLHVGLAGANAAPIHLAASPSANPIIGSVVLDATQRAALANHGLYFQVATGAHPAGEVRGQLELTGTLGAGTIIGVLDTGINSDHPSFAAVAGDGYQHVNPRGANQYLGHCATTPSFCNDKLIGAYSFVTETTTPEDSDGHGSHTASTAAGNILLDAQFIAPTTSFSFSGISGVAPRANLIAYDVCTVGCPGSALLAAVDRAIQDGVDVINFSISGGVSPYVDATSLAFRSAYAAGVIIATSAGNSGPTISTVNHQEPWTMSVAAATHNRSIRNRLTSLVGNASTLPDIVGEGPTTGTSGPIVYSGAAPFNNPLCNPVPAGTYAGLIVICDRGVFSRVAKGSNVLAGGAIGMVLANDAPNAASLNADPHVLPAIHISHSDGIVLKTWLAANATATASLTAGGVDTADAGDVLASFSSRGPATTMVRMIKPDLAAPGLNILAATASLGSPPPPEFSILSGTSMASPHVAGSAALLRILHPDWTPSEVKSALMLTATPDVLREDGIASSTAFDIGAGRAELRRASDVGFVLDMTEAEMTAANPATGGDPRTLNSASLADDQCIGTCTWTRTVRSTLDASQSYQAGVVLASGGSGTVSPSSFTLAAGASQTLTITATPLPSSAAGTWQFGEVLIAPTGGNPQIADARMPVALRYVTSNYPSLVTVQAFFSAGTQALTDVRSQAVTGLTTRVRGLQQATVAALSLSGDPTNSDPYNGDGSSQTLVSVPAGARRLVAQIIASEAADTDLYIGTGSVPSAATQICASASGVSLEYCNVNDPPAGDYWILVHNWQASGMPPDDIALAHAVVPGSDGGNMTVTGPASVPVGQTYDLNIHWNSAAIAPFTRWYGQFDVGPDAANPGTIGIVNVDLFRNESVELFEDGFEN